MKALLKDGKEVDFEEIGDRKQESMIYAAPS
jgi:hypothetical protein